MEAEFKFPGNYRTYEGRIKIPRINVLLFIATFLSTFLVQGFYYAISIMTILLAHELGHYFACRKYKVPATIPFFIPFPPLPKFPSLLGTFGAVIKMQGIIPNRKALFDIGVAGPLMGLVFAIPAIVIGLKYSTVVTGGIPPENLSLGEPIIFKFISNLVIGKIPENADIMLHPVAFAGWAGLLVTAINLIPIGQLDGGHVIYSILGYRSVWVYRILFAALVLVAVFFNPGWIIFLILIYFFVKLKHPPTLYDSEPLDKWRIILGIIMIGIFIVSFTPEPIKLPESMKLF
jgi:membrane-associated protease RseP (regulator of RpoE activity)